MTDGDHLGGCGLWWLIWSGVASVMTGGIVWVVVGYGG